MIKIVLGKNLDGSKNTVEFAKEDILSVEVNIPENVNVSHCTVFTKNHGLIAFARITNPDKWADFAMSLLMLKVVSDYAEDVLYYRNKNDE